MFSKKNRIIFYFLILFAVLSMSLIRTSTLALDSPIVEEPYFLTNANDVYQVLTKSVFDQQNNLHLFIRLTFQNGTFSIIHIVNDQIILVEDNYYASTIFDVFIYPEGIALFYSFEGEFFGTIIKMYTWAEGVSNTHNVYSATRYIYEFKLSQNENAINLFFTEYNEFSDSRTTLNQFKIFFNGIKQEQIYTIDFQTNSFLTAVEYENIVYALFQFTDYDPENGTYPTSLILVGLTDSNNFTSNIITGFTDSHFNSDLKISDNGMFHLALISYNFVFTTSFKPNSNFTSNDFRYRNVNFYIYDTFDSYIYDNISFYVFYTIYYAYFEESRSTSSNLIKPRISVFVSKNESLLSHNINVENGVEEYYQQAVSSYFFENGSYVLTYNSILEREEVSKYRLSSSSALAVNLLSNIDLDMPKKPYLYGIISLSPLTYFLLRYWYAFVIPISILAIGYGIFYQKINKMLRKLKNYLIRPIVDEKSRFKLVLINLWLFISNAYSLIFSLWKSNKRRMIISLLGFTLLSSIILTSTTLYDSKKNSLITEYVREYDLENNGLITGVANINLNNYDITPSKVFNKNFSSILGNEVFTSIKTFSADITKIVNNLEMSFSMELFDSQNEYYSSFVRYFGYNDTYSKILNPLLISGTLPTKPGEILISEYYSAIYSLEPGDSVVLNATSRLDAIVDSVTLKITGILRTPSYSVLETLCKANNLASDVVQDAIISERTFFAPQSIYMVNLENITTFNLDIYSVFQLIYDFSNFKFDQLEGMLEDFDDLVYEGPYNFIFITSSFWEMYDEFYNVFDNLSTILSATQFLIIFLSIPILYLGWFLIFEVNELFGSSFEQEIRILRSKGVSTGNITFIYLSMKFIESVIASFLGFGLTMLLLPPLLRIDRFLSFNSEIALISLQSLPIALSLSFVLLIGISIPRIIKLTQEKKQVVKPPRRFVQVLKNFRLHYLFIILFGAGLVFLSFYLFYLFFYSIVYSGDLGLLLVFVYLAGIGIMIILLGLGLLLKDLHKMLMIVISKITWSSGKNIFSFSLVEVRSDVNLFNTTFLTYVILIGIVMPFIVSPISIQNTVETEAFFYGGSDLYIDNWQLLNSSIRTSLVDYDEIEGFSNISVNHFQYGSNVFDVFVLNDPSTFLTSAYKPPNHLLPNWEEMIMSLNDESTMLVSKSFYIYMAAESNTFTFFYHTGPILNQFTYDITGVFSYFPIFYDVGDNQYIREYSIVTTMDNFMIMNSSFLNLGLSTDRMLIKLKSLINPIKFAEKLESELNINVNVAQEEAEKRLFNIFPFYSLIVAEFVFGILICIAVTVFTSISNPLKILQNRSTKHDVLKKIGIPTSSIIFTSAIEFLIASMVPGLIIGGVAGFGLVRLFDYLLLQMTYSSLPNVLYLPIGAFLLIFAGIPVLFYSIFYSSMKYNFAKYRPQNLE